MIFHLVRIYYEQIFQSMWVRLTVESVVCVCVYVTHSAKIYIFRMHIKIELWKKIELNSTHEIPEFFHKNKYINI